MKASAAIDFSWKVSYTNLIAKNWSAIVLNLLIGCCISFLLGRTSCVMQYVQKSHDKKYRRKTVAKWFQPLYGTTYQRTSFGEAQGYYTLSVLWSETKLLTCNSRTLMKKSTIHHLTLLMPKQLNGWKQKLHSLSRFHSLTEQTANDSGGISRCHETSLLASASIFLILSFTQA